MNPLQRLFGYARPYRGRLALAVVGMVFYAVASAGLAALIKPIFDSVLPTKEKLALMAWAIVGLYLLKGIGSYASSYLMADVGQRVVMDLRNALYRHILGQSAGFSRSGRTGQLMSRINNDVGQVQQAVSETAGDLARESLALVGYAALLFYLRRAADDRLHDRRAAHRVSADPSRPARAPDDEAQPGGARAASRTSAPRRSPATASSRRSAPKRTRRRSSAAPATTCSAPT